MNKMSVIINCYGPLDSIQYFYKTASSLKQSNGDSTEVNLIFSDSSPEDVYKSNDLYLNSLFDSCFFKHIKLDNKGEPYALNKVIDYAAKYNPDLIMILTDDAILMSSLPYSNIFEYFSKNCKPESDILLLTDDNTIIQGKEVKRSTENGMIFSPNLFGKIKFRDELIMDQFDLIFCDTIYQIGGKIKVFPHTLLGVGPIGREKNHGHSFIPPWRMYLLIRNTLSLWMEGKYKLFNDVLIGDFYWILKSLFYSKRKDKLTYFRAIFLGLIDGIKQELGITKTLTELSNGRFQ